MATNILELATTLKYLGAKWLPEKKLILHPAVEVHVCIPTYLVLSTGLITSIGHRKEIRTLETSVFQSLKGGQFTLSP